MDLSVAQLLVSVLVADMENWEWDKTDLLAADEKVGLGLKKLATLARRIVNMERNKHCFHNNMFCMVGWVLAVVRCMVGLERSVLRHAGAGWYCGYWVCVLTRWHWVACRVSR